MNVVMVHGILDTGRIFNKMKGFYEQKGLCCYAPSLKPSDARTGIDDLAIQLKHSIAKMFNADRSITIIGFSMGAIIARYYLQMLDGHQTTRQFFSISGPHKGSLWSYFFPGKGAKQMRPDSELINSLDNTKACLHGIKIYSYWTPFDLVIIPPSSSIWNLAQNQQINAWCHPCMLKNQRLIADIYNKITGQLPHQT